MLKEPNHIDDLFNDFLHDYEEPAPMYSWNNIKEELHARKKLRILSRLRAFAATIAMLIAFGLGYYSNLEAVKKIAENSHKNQNLFWEAVGDSLGLIKSKKENKHTKQKTKNNQETRKVLKNNFSVKNINSEDTKTEYLLKKYKHLFILFAQKESKEKKEQLVSSQKSNQLLTDTLLLRKENLQAEGFPSIKKTKNKESAWSFGTKFSPVFQVEEETSATQETNGVKTEVNNSQQNLVAKEKSVTSFAGGININYQLSKKVSVESGLFYLNKKQNTENLIASRNTEFGNSNYTVYTPEQTVSIENIDNANKIKQNYSTAYYSLDANYVANAEYIELPLIIRYKLINQKLGLDLMSGISTNFLVNNSSYIISGDSKLWSSTPELNSIYYGASLGLGINYRFYQNFSFNLEPTFKYSFLSENSIFRKYPYSFAVFAGFSYRFK